MVADRERRTQHRRRRAAAHRPNDSARAVSERPRVTRAASIAEAGIARAPPLLPLSLSRTAHDPPARASPSHAPPRTVRARTAADASTWAHVDSGLLGASSCVLLGMTLT